MYFCFDFDFRLTESLTYTQSTFLRMGRHFYSPLYLLTTQTKHEGKWLNTPKYLDNLVCFSKEEKQNRGNLNGRWELCRPRFVQILLPLF